MSPPIALAAILVAAANSGQRAASAGDQDASSSPWPLRRATPQRAAVVGRRETLTGGRNEMQPLSRQPQIRGDLRIDRQRCAQRRHAEAGRDLVRDGAAADLVALSSTTTLRPARAR